MTEEKKLGTILTICKGINHASDVKLNNESKLILVPEPMNPYDCNAIRICLLTSEAESLSSSSKSSLETNVKNLSYCGYLPRKLALSIVKFISHKSIRNECVLLAPSDEGLSRKMNLYASFDIQLNFYCSAKPDKDIVVDSELIGIIQFINQDPTNRI